LAVLLALGLSARADDDVKKLEAQIVKFVEEKEKILNSLHEKMLREIKGVEKRVRFSKIDADAKRLMLERVEQEYQRCDSTGQLPSCDELLGVALKYAEDCQRILQDIEKQRKRLVNLAVQQENPAIADKLGALEDRVTQLMGGRVTFQPGTVWKGRWSGNKGDAIEEHLHIKEVSGGKFKAELHQLNAFGRPDIMKIEGEQNGFAVEMHTVGMLRGANRELQFQGCVLGPRILVAVSGRTPRNNPASGWLSLNSQ